MQQAPKKEFDIIDTDDYKLRVTKTWVPATAVWHIKIQSRSVFDYSFECFLTDDQLKLLKDVL
jgi:hypothetical protein